MTDLRKAVREALARHDDRLARREHGGVAAGLFVDEVRAALSSQAAPEKPPEPRGGHCEGCTGCHGCDDPAVHDEQRCECPGLPAPAPMSDTLCKAHRYGRSPVETGTACVVCNQIAPAPADVAGWLRARGQKYRDRYNELLQRDYNSEVGKLMSQRDYAADAMEAAAAAWERDHPARGEDTLSETLESQVDRLANFIMAEVPGEPSQSEGAIDTAIRIIRTLQARVEEKS